MARRGKIGNASGEKPKDRKAVLKRLWSYMYAYKWHVFTALLLTALTNILSLLGPYLSGKAVDSIAADFDRVVFFCSLMIAFYAASSVISYLLQKLMINLSQKIVYRMRKDVFDNLARLPVSFFDKYQTGDIVSRISYDIDTVNSSLSSDVVQIFTSVFTVAGSFYMMLVISPPLILVFAVTIPMAFLFTAYMVKRVRPYFRLRSGKLGALNGYVEEMVSGHKTIKAYNAEKTVIDKFDEKNEDASQAYYMAEFHSSKVGPNVNFVNNLSLTLISVFGIFLYLGKKLSIGDLSSFVLYSRKFSGPINETANIISEIQSAMAAAERVFAMIDQNPEPADSENAKTLCDACGDVEFSHVKFGYLPEKTVIHDFSLHAEPGKLIAIVGHTGAGKTTIINLLMRFYDPESGVIRIDGTENTDFTRASLRGSFAMVLQDTWLFEGTIFENIAYASNGASIEDVKRVCMAAKIDSFIESLPDGYNARLGENGVNISQGQKQLMTIARAMLQDASMLILDEATSNVDTRTEVLISDAMRELMRDKTCFVIAHRLSTIQNADCILVMKDGDVCETGTHDELLKKNGIYAGLYNSQFI